MKYITFSLWACCLLLCGTGPVLAQAGVEHQQVQERLDSILERLELTDSQREVVDPIIRTSLFEQYAVLERFGFSERRTPNLSTNEQLELFSELEEIRRSAEARIEPHLDKKQLKRYKKAQNEIRQRFRRQLRRNRPR